MNRNEIEQKMIRDAGTSQTRITDFNLASVARGFIRAVSWVAEALWYSLNRTQRKMFLATATGTDLDALGEERGVTRRDANASGVVLTFRDPTGATGAVIPAGSTIRSQEGIIFETQYSVTIGADNPILGGDVYAAAFQNSTYAVATTTGSNTNVPALSVINPVSGVPAGILVNNPYPAQYGRDEETDDEYRYRIAHRVDLLDQGTQAAYESQAMEEPTVGDQILRTLAVRVGAHQVKVFIVTRDAGGLAAGELTTLAAYLEDHQSITTSVTCENVTFTPVEVEVTVRLESGETVATVYPRIADKLADYIDWEYWGWGQDVDDAALLSVVRQAEGISDLDVASFEPDDNVDVGNHSLPRLINLKVIDSSNPLVYIDSSTYVPPGLETTYEHSVPGSIA